MPLPKMVTPTFESTIPSTKKTIKIRPFLVKEHKILLMSQESSSESDIYDAVSSVLTNCILTEGIVVDNLSTFDVQYLFLQVRSQSINGKIPMRYKCLGEDCRGMFNHTFEISELEVEFPGDTEKKIALSDKVGIEFHYPTFKDLRTSLDGEEKGTNINYELIKRCIVCIYDNDNVYDDFTMEEFETFMDSLTSGQLDQITNFFDALPKLHYEIPFVCPKCNKKEDLVLTSLSDFFVLV